MSKRIILVFTVMCLGFLSSCDKPVKTDLSKLTCNDNPEGRPREEQVAIADACFRRGSYTKSSGMTW